MFVCFGVSGDSIWNSCLGTTALAVSTNIPEEVSSWILMSCQLHSATSVCVHMRLCMCVYVHCQVKLYSQVFVSARSFDVVCGYICVCVCVFTCLRVCVYVCSVCLAVWLLVACIVCNDYWHFLL